MSTVTRHAYTLQGPNQEPHSSTQPSESKTTLNAASDRNKLLAQREYRDMSYSRTPSGSQYKLADVEGGNDILSDRDSAILRTV